MKVFVTGASGFVGSAIVQELIGEGHQVVGLARSDKSAASVAAAGAEVLRGDLDDLDSLRRGAAAADGVIHCAFKHDFANFAASAEADRCAIETIGAVLAGSNRPFIVTAGTPGLVEGRVVTEDDVADPGIGRFSEVAALLLAAQGVRVSVLRLPRSVHGEGDQGFVPMLITLARQKGVSAYPGDGSSRWPAVHRLDTARLFRLALESAPTGARLHAVGDDGIAVRDIAGVIGRHLNLPVSSVPLSEADEHFGPFIGRIFGYDCPSTSTLTQQRFDWHPTQPGLLADLEQGHYFTPP
ncbi:MAG: SDR family oxidoreductase [Chloroflexota bacterium]